MLRDVSERLARRTSRRGLFGRGADVLFGTLAGVAAGAATRAGRVSAGANTLCAFPFGRPCPCDGCQTSGVCAKPCIIYTFWYSNGCWTTGAPPITCCDCDCGNIGGDVCGCGTDYHNNSSFCPEA